MKKENLMMTPAEDYEPEMKKFLNRTTVRQEYRLE